MSQKNQVLGAFHGRLQRRVFLAAGAGLLAATPGHGQLRVAAPVTVNLNADGIAYLGDEAVALPDLVRRLTEAAHGERARRIFVRVDNAVPYGQVMRVMSTIAGGGFTKVALVAQQNADTAPAP